MRMITIQISDLPIMKVLIVGFSKTGTKSLDKALQVLGYRVSGYGRASTDMCDDWIQYMEGEGSIEDLKRMYEGYDATSGSPTFHYWEDFLEAFPNIKLIHMTRDEDSWVESWKREIEAENSSALSFPLAYFSPSARKRFKFHHIIGRINRGSPPQRFNKIFQGISDENWKKIFREHNENILKKAPANQLMVFDLKDGWEPLCKYLNKEVPEGISFPHINKSNSLVSGLLNNEPQYAKMYTEMYITIALIIAAFSVVLILCFI